MKKLFLILSIATLFAGYTWADVTIKFSHVVAPTTPKGKMADHFKQLIEERSNGEIKVEVYPNSQLYNDDKVLEALLMGDVQMAAPSLSKFSRLTPKLQVYNLPFLFKDMDAVDRFQKSEIGQSLLQSINSRGLIGLGYIHNGLKQFSANSPIHTPEDMKGKKFRIEPSDVLAAQMEQVGAVPLKKPFAEVFTLLQTKAIDGQESPWSNTYSQKFYEVQPYITETNHSLLDYMVITSQKFMDSLTADQQAMVKQAIRESIDYGNSLAKQINDQDKQKIAESGYSKIIELTPEQRAVWVETMRPVWKKFEKSIGKEIIDAAEQSNTVD